LKQYSKGEKHYFQDGCNRREVLLFENDGDKEKSDENRGIEGVQSI
jgi:hypothetical protein